MSAATVTKPRATTEDDITAEVLRRFDNTEDPRLRRIMQSLVRHVHAFVKDVQLSEQEWWKAIDFLTRTGQKCDSERQEFILLSDVLGVSMVTDLISNRKPQGATESTVFGPFHREGAPELPAGADMGTVDRGGTAAIVTGRVLDLEGNPIANALLDVWQAAPDGLYDVQDPTLDHTNMRGKYRTDAEGRYFVRATRPVPYSIPADGPVGEMLKACHRSPWRPAHMHFLVSAEGYSPVTTHVFDSRSPHLDDDAVFGVKNSLIVDFVEHTAVDGTSERYGIAPPFVTAEYDFVLAPAKRGTAAD